MRKNFVARKAQSSGSERYGKPIDQISASQVFAGILLRLAQ
jgi:hypothetical protein